LIALTLVGDLDHVFNKFVFREGGLNSRLEDDNLRELSSGLLTAEVMQNKMKRIKENKIIPL